MKLTRILPRFLVGLLVAATVACSNMPTTTLLDKEVIALRSVTSGRQVATGLLRAGKITVAQDQAAQARFTLAATAIKAAVAANDPATVEAEKLKAEKLTAELEKK